MLCAAGSANAAITPDSPIIDDTAYILHHREYMVGFLEVGVGLFDRVQITSWTLPWLIGAQSLAIKALVYEWNDLSFALELGLFHFKSKDFSNQPIWAWPSNLAVSWRATESLTASLMLFYNTISLDLTGDWAEDSNYQGEGRLTTISLFPTLEWRLSDHFALLLSAGILLDQWFEAATNSEQQIDDRTRMWVYGKGTLDTNISGDFFGKFGFLWSGDVFNLRLEVSMGDYMLPGFRVFNPASRINGMDVVHKIPIPSLDLFWRW